MPDIDSFARLVAADHGLAVVAIALPDRTVHASVANAGVVTHPHTQAPVVGLVAAGNTRKLAHLRDHPRASVTVRAGWQWAAVEGPVQIIGPDDPAPGMDADGVRRLLREIFTAAGGTHDDWETYD